MALDRFRSFRPTPVGAGEHYPDRTDECGDDRIVVREGAERPRLSPADA